MKSIYLVSNVRKFINTQIHTSYFYGVNVYGTRLFIALNNANNRYHLKSINNITTSKVYSQLSGDTLDALITKILDNHPYKTVIKFTNSREFSLWLAGNNEFGEKVEYITGPEEHSLNSPPSTLRYYGVEGDGLKFYITQQSDGLFTVKTPSLMLHTSCIKTGNNISELMIKLLNDGYRIIEFDNYHNLLDWLAS